MRTLNETVSNCCCCCCRVAVHAIARWRRRRTTMTMTQLARSLRCASFELRFDTERGPRASKAEQVSERNSTTKLYNVSRLYRFSKCSRSLMLSLSLSPLSTDRRSLWAALHAPSALLSGLISSLSRISFSFSICVEKFIHCCCSSATAACVCKYCLADDFWLIELTLTLLCLHAYRAVTENSRSRWRKQHASRAEAPRSTEVPRHRLTTSHTCRRVARGVIVKEREKVGGRENEVSEGERKREG